MLWKTDVSYQKNSAPYKTGPEPVRKTAGTLKISADYTYSVRTLRAAVLANLVAGRGRVAGERVDDISLEIIDTVPLLDQAARRTLRLVAGQLKRACTARRSKSVNGNNHN